MMIDGVEMNEGDRILVTAQRTRRQRLVDWLLRRKPASAENGIYVFAAGGWERP